MIDVKGLTKTYGDHQVLKGINEHISKGEKVAIIGPSGSGKSTFLRCLNLLEEPTSGTITFEGVDITNPKNDINKLRARMGMVFQQFNLFPHMTVKQNITLAPTKLKLMTKAQADKKGPGAAGAGGPAGQGQRLPQAAFRRPAAAHRHCPGFGHEPGCDAL